MSVLHDLIKASFGITTSTETDLVAGVGSTTPAEVVKANPDRIGLIIVNNGTSNATVSPTGKTSATRGIFLGAGGGGVSLQWDRDFAMIGNRWTAITASGTTDLYITEVIGSKKD